MYELIKLFFDICLLKKSPQDIPSSYALLYSLIAVYALISFLLLYITADWFDSLLQVAAEITLMLVFAKIALFLVRKRERYVQTASALFGTDALISFFALPGLTSMMAGRMTLLAFFVILALMMWHWLVTGHIIRHALAQSLPFSLGIAFLYLFAMYQILAFLFPEAV
ncbi:MAG: hypothetical protein CVV13_09580 [Gammaproteobacteria bacterium HGW-Gammaproteobacteria-3]|nr:MAG: hypothetical protein CVV13_09580 [Gammaproteobacteria bacterium HGW-Gammaproteobacteria-3]